MSDDRLERILDAAYTCFTRHGIRRTTMDDIAAGAGMSRPAVYQYVRGKEDVFGRLAVRLFGAALEAARDAAARPGPVVDKLVGVCAAKLELTLRIWADSPHAAELVAGARAGHDAEFTAGVRDVLVGVLTEAGAKGEVDLGSVAGGAAEVAELLLALTRGLEADPRHPDAPRALLRGGVTLLAAGLAPA